MPIYEYVCLDCETRFDENVPIKDRDLVACENCGSEMAIRQFNTPSLHIPQEYVRKHRGMDGVVPDNVEEIQPRSN